MASSNPMQKKAKSSFILGMLLMAVILGAVIALMFLQLKNYREKEQAQKASLTSAYVLGQDVKSGQVITKDMLIIKEVDKNSVPSNAVMDPTIIESFGLTDKAGNSITTKYSNNTATLTLKRSDGDYELKQEEETKEYYIQKGNNKEYIETTTTPIVAKVDMKANTILTPALLAKSDETTTDDLRKQEYNMIVLPSQLESKEYIDIRLALPTGQDYIVVSKKEVTIPTLADGTVSENDIWLNMTEGEIITMNNAIVDAYRIDGSKLYATTYVEAGTQDAATPTYVPSAEVIQLIDKDPNLVQKARDQLVLRYNENRALTRDEALNEAIRDAGEEGEGRIKSKTEESITNSQSSRKQYLDSLITGGSTGTN